MKIVGKIVVLSLVAAVFVGAFILIGKTSWADGVREEVARRRAARRAQMEAASRPGQDSARPQTKNSAPFENAKRSGNGPRFENNKKDGGVGSSRNGRGPGKGNGPGKGRPGPKPPRLDGAAAAEFGGYFGGLTLSALVSGGALAFVRRRRATSLRSAAR